MFRFNYNLRKYMCNSIGVKFRVTTFGESHSKALGAVIDGCPAGVEFCEGDITKYLNGSGVFDCLKTRRNEPNQPEILSGVYKGRTLGTPVAIVIHNKAADSSQYMRLEGIARPSHAEYEYYSKFGLYDPRGGGRSSGRECVSRHAAAALADKILTSKNIILEPSVIELGGIKITDDQHIGEILKSVLEKSSAGDSTGGIFEVKIKNLPAGVGSPVFQKLDAQIASAVMSVGGVKSVEIGSGIEAARLSGKEANDVFCYDDAGALKTRTNHSGGICGGISTGFDIIVRAAVKPTPSIYIEQDTIDFYHKKNVKINLKGRFDVNFTPRAMAAAVSTLKIIILDNLILSGIIPPDKI